MYDIKLNFQFAFGLSGFDLKVSICSLISRKLWRASFQTPKSCFNVHLLNASRFRCFPLCISFLESCQTHLWGVNLRRKQKGENSVCVGVRGRHWSGQREGKWVDWTGGWDGVHDWIVPNRFHLDICTAKKNEVLLNPMTSHLHLSLAHLSSNLSPFCETEWLNFNVFEIHPSWTVVSKKLAQQVGLFALPMPFLVQT